MNSETRLDIHPQELRFLFELNKEASTRFRVSNISRHHVAFKVRTTNPDNYFGQPAIEVVLPQSACDVRVTMVAPRVAPPGMHTRDEFIIQSIVVPPGTTAEQARQLFAQRPTNIGISRLRVVYVAPTHRAMMHQYLQEDDGNWAFLRNWYVQLIGAVVVWIFFRYLMLPLIWGVAFVVVLLITRVANQVVSDSVGDWIERLMVPVLIHFITTLFQRIWNKLLGL